MAIRESTEQAKKHENPLEWGVSDSRMINICRLVDTKRFLVDLAKCAIALRRQIGAAVHRGVAMQTGQTHADMQPTVAGHLCVAAQLESSGPTAMIGIGIWIKKKKFSSGYGQRVASGGNSVKILDRKSVV